jgi:hypothetical protein
MDKTKETPLLYSMRTNNADICNSLLFLCPEVYAYDMIC